jgi:glycosyltransferase involved in cell wall biosynthesis
VPRILYHWRQIETSVSVGGLDAKPYAAQGQLCAVNKYLPVAGWPDASAIYDGHNIRIAWGAGFRPVLSVILLGGDICGKWNETAARLGVELTEVRGDITDASLAHVMAQAHSEIIVLLDGRFWPENDDWLAEMIGPLVNKDIALVGGCVRDESDLIVDFGVFFQDGVPYPAFRGEPLHYFGPAGGCGWYRNAMAAAGGALAFRKSLWDTVGGFTPTYDAAPRPDLLFCLEVARRGLGRLLLNPYARFRTAQNVPNIFEVTASHRPPSPAAVAAVAAVLPQGDPFINPNLDAAVYAGAPRLRMVEPVQVPSHDFAAEARHVAASYDVTSDDIAASVAACALATAGPLRRMLWIVPGFEVAFYGGIHTILRTADYMRREQGVEQSFAVLTCDGADVILARIARAFPELAEAVKLATFEGGEVPAQLGHFDAAVCTLWTTAYPLLSMRGVRRKFYFLQDWEALFYPAGTISSAVETTYRFGFHGICNTPSLAESYRAFGGQADFFLPAVDPAVFHANGRQLRALNEPFVLVCYARPGTPRNCFEALSEGLRLLKQRYGDRIEIVSAGSGWNTAQFELSGVLRNLGLLPYAETGALYRIADAGLVAMATRHPSYLPFELMACGAAVVTTRNPYTSWLLRDGENCLLCEMTRSDITDTVSRLIEDSTLRDKIANSGRSDMEARHQNWTATLKGIHDSMAQICER